MLIIKPYKINGKGAFVFDDSTFGLVKEPFVCGASEMLDLLSIGCRNPADGFDLLFSMSPFPGAESFTWLQEQSGGNWYVWDKNGMEFWLCPAGGFYIPKGTQKIYGIAKDFT